MTTEEQELLLQHGKTMQCIGNTIIEIGSSIKDLSEAIKMLNDRIIHLERMMGIRK